VRFLKTKVCEKISGTSNTHVKSMPWSSKKQLLKPYSQIDEPIPFVSISIAPVFGVLEYEKSLWDFGDVYASSPRIEALNKCKRK